MCYLYQSMLIVNDQNLLIVNERQSDRLMYSNQLKKSALKLINIISSVYFYYIIINKQVFHLELLHKLRLI